MLRNTRGNAIQVRNAKIFYSLDTLYKITVSPPAMAQTVEHTGF